MRNVTVRVIHNEGVPGWVIGAVCLTIVLLWAWARNDYVKRMPG
jgi:hypothetical protein